LWIIHGTVENVWSVAASAMGREAWRSAVKAAKNVKKEAQIGGLFSVT
jgi:hypothetical protein